MGPMEDFGPTEMDADFSNPGMTFKSTKRRFLGVVAHGGLRVAATAPCASLWGRGHCTEGQGRHPRLQ